MPSVEKPLVSAAPAQRPRPLAVPDVVEMIPARVLSDARAAALRGSPSDILYEIVTGPLVGHELVSNVTSWDVTFQFVALADLSLTDRIRYFPAFTEQWKAIDAAAVTGARLDPLGRMLAKTPLLLATSVDSKGDYRIVQVGFAGEGGGTFFFRMRRAGHDLARIEGPLWVLRDSIDPPLEHVSHEGDERLLDRILGAASHGLVSARAITLAFYLSETPDGAHWSAGLPAAREGDGARAAAVIGALATAEGKGLRVIDLPGFGLAHRETLPAFVLKMPEHDLDVMIGDVHELAVPSEDVWIVAAPPPPSAVSAFPSSPPPAANVKGAERRALYVVLGILGILVVAVLLGRLRARGVGAACATSTDCQSRVCVTPALSDREGYCSKHCIDATDCPSDYACVDLGARERACVFGR